MVSVWNWTQRIWILPFFPLTKYYTLNFVILHFDAKAAKCEIEINVITNTLVSLSVYKQHHTVNTKLGPCIFTLVNCHYAVLRDVIVGQVKNERQVCEVLLKWFERRRANGNEVTESCLYLGLIRWSGIDAEYLRTTVVNHAAIKQSAESTSYLSRVIIFQKTGMQFDGLQTWHRLKTKLERCILAIVSGGVSPFAAAMCAVSAQLTCSVEPHFGDDLPFSGTPLEAAATVVDSTMYVVGVGDDNDQIWAYDTSNGWRRCCGGWGGLVAGRRRHSVVTVNGQYVYSVAGYCPRNRSLVSFVERFDPSDNRNIVVDGVVAVMPCPVLSAAAAVYNDDIYVFGGTNDENETINLVQVP